MPCISRVDWIARQISDFHRTVHITTGRARADGKVKFRFILHSPETPTYDVFVKQCLLMQIQAIRQLVVGGVAVDRGHKFSDGHSEVAIWISQSPLSTSYSNSVPRNTATSSLDPSLVPAPAPATRDTDSHATPDAGSNFLPITTASYTSDTSPTDAQANASSDTVASDDSAPLEDAVAKFDSQLSETLVDLLDSQQDSVASLFARLGVDISNREVLPIFFQTGPRQQVELALRKLMVAFVVSHPGLQTVAGYERFLPLLDEVLETHIPIMTDHLLSSIGIV